MNRRSRRSRRRLQDPAVCCQNIEYSKQSWASNGIKDFIQIPPQTHSNYSFVDKQRTQDWLHRICSFAGPLLLSNGRHSGLQYRKLVNCHKGREKVGFQGVVLTVMQDEGRGGITVAKAGIHVRKLPEDFLNKNLRPISRRFA